MPWVMRSRARESTWNCSSSSSSSVTRSARKTLATRESQDMAPPRISGVLQDMSDCGGDRPPPRFLGLELAAAGSGDVVRASAALAFRLAPPGPDPSRLFHPVQRRIQRAFLNSKHVVKRLDLRGDGVAMERASPGEERQHEEGERPLEGIIAWHA